MEKPNNKTLKIKKPVGTLSDRINTKNKHYLTNTIVYLFSTAILLFAIDDTKMRLNFTMNNYKKNIF